MSEAYRAQPGVPSLVVDPGVWISALIGRPGPPDELLQAAAEGRAVVLVSPLLLAELREVVNRAKFRRYFTIEEAESFIAALELLAHHVEDPSRDRWVQICPDPDDDYLVALSHRSPDQAPSRTKSR